MEAAGERFRSWPPYADIANFLRDRSEVVATPRAPDSEHRWNGLARVAAEDWRDKHREDYWNPAIRGGYGGEFGKWLVKAFFDIAAAGGVTGVFQRFDGRDYGYTLDRTQDIRPEDWQVDKWAADAAERRACHAKLRNAPAGFRGIELDGGAPF